MTGKTRQDEPFEGFDPPFYTSVPDAIFDRFLHQLTGAELKVILYICRRTFGFKKTDDDISISQLMNGITKKDGTVLDYGTGLSRDSVTRATKSLEERGLIVRFRRSSSAKGDMATTYTLKMKGSDGGVRISDTGVSENRTRPVRISDTQETVRQDTDETRPVEEIEDNDTSIIRRVFIEVCREFGDQASDRSIGQRAVNLWRHSGMSRAEFIKLAYQARERTRLYQGKQPAGTKIESKPAYFFEIIENDIA